MKILLDECVVQDFRKRLKGHQVFTVGFMGWSGLKNGRLLAAAVVEAFEAIVTTDQNIAYQQNLGNIPLALVILIAPSNDIDDLDPLVPKLLLALKKIRPGTIARIRQTNRP
jgi:hypothetical protein